MTTIRAVIVEDEPLARRRMQDLLGVETGVEIVGEATNVREAVEAISTLEPDLVFLDVQMPSGTGFDVIEEVGTSTMPMVIFVTGHDGFAIRAFEASALDYIVKPFSQERLRESVDRARHRMRRGSREEVVERLDELSDQLLSRPYSDEHVIVRTGARIRFIPKTEVDWVEGEGNYVRIHVGATSHLLRTTLSSMEEELAPLSFVRIHRSTIINIRQVRELESVYQGEYLVILKDGTKLTSTRTYRRRLEEALGLRRSYS